MTGNPLIQNTANTIGMVFENKFKWHFIKVKPTKWQSIKKSMSLYEDQFYRFFEIDEMINLQLEKTKNWVDLLLNKKWHKHPHAAFS